MPARVFITYRQENDGHCARVRELALRLETTGLTVVLDQFAQEREFRGGGPNEGWPHWSTAQAEDEGHKILIIATPGWIRCYEQKEIPGVGLGAASEANAIYQRLYNSAGNNRYFRIVTFDPINPSELPINLQPFHRFVDPTDFRDITSWLTGTGMAAPPVAGWPGTAPALDWPVADHRNAHKAFENLLTSVSRFRYLPLQGPSEAGKSHITKHMFGNALCIPGLPCGLLDFKGTTSMETELRAFSDNLQIPLPSSTLSLNARLAHIFDALKTRARPALLVFDTYEVAGEARDWIERQLLPGIIRETWLRVVIAGQRVPEPAGTFWSSHASHVIRLAPPPPEDWFAFGQPHKPGITLEFVRQVHGYCNGKASVLAQLLGPS